MLASPNQCENMALYEKNHPSARHSQVNWSDPVDWENFPQFKQAMGNEVVLQAGDALYLPNNWFHHIISLELNFQCNTRSGRGPEYMQEIWDCGFDEI
jgi:ribosomal protein L16 Arg81 hydroxylase